MRLYMPLQTTECDTIKRKQSNKLVTRTAVLSAGGSRNFPTTNDASFSGLVLAP